MKAHEMRTVVNCRNRTAREVLLEIVPICLQARSRGERASIQVANLESLGDSVTRLLKALDRLTADLGAHVVLADSSGFSEAFRNLLSYTEAFLSVMEHHSPLEEQRSR